MKTLILIAAVIVATSAVGGTASGPAVHIKDDAYGPTTLTVRAGQMVTFVNDDDDAHTVTASDGSFDSKGLDTHQTWQYRFTKPGTYAYFCELHPFMKATIVVKAAAQ